MTTENWDLRAFIFGCQDLDDEEKHICYNALNKEGFSAANKRRAFFALDDNDLRSAGVTCLGTRKVLLLAISGTTASAGAFGSAGGRDTSTTFIRDVLLAQTAPAADLLGNARHLARMLDQPLGAKLPVFGQLAHVRAALTDNEVWKYVEPQPLDQLAQGADRLRSHVSGALAGGTYQPRGSEVMTTIRVSALVDATLFLAASSLSLAYYIDRNIADQSGAIVRGLRPDFLFFLLNILFFKGEEKADPLQLPVAISELPGKLSDSWSPTLLPGVSLPCMFAYAAAGNLMQFFVITSRDGAVEMTAASDCLDINTPLGRIKVVHYTLKVLQAVAAYAPHAPDVPIALGYTNTQLTSDGSFLRSVGFFPDFVRKRVNLALLWGGVLNSTGLTAMYGAIGSARCPNLVRLRGGVKVEKDGTTVLLHLEPLGKPVGQHGEHAIRSEAHLRLAVSGVLTGLAVLHDAGYVHRDIRWPNVIMLPPPAEAAAANSGRDSSPADTYVLIDLEHAAPADCLVDCRQSPYWLRVWPTADRIPLLDPDSGRYTRESDLCLVASELMSSLPFALSGTGQQLRQQLATRQLPSARAALEHAWLQAAPAAVPQG